MNPHRLAMVRYDVVNRILETLGYWDALPVGYAMNSVLGGIVTLRRLDDGSPEVEAGLKWCPSIVQKVRFRDNQGALQAAKAMARHFPIPDR